MVHFLTDCDLWHDSDVALCALRCAHVRCVQWLHACAGPSKVLSTISSSKARASPNRCKSPRRSRSTVTKLVGSSWVPVQKASRVRCTPRHRWRDHFHIELVAYSVRRTIWVRDFAQGIHRFGEFHCALYPFSKINHPHIDGTLQYVLTTAFKRKNSSRCPTSGGADKQITRELTPL